MPIQVRVSVSPLLNYLLEFTRFRGIYDSLDAY